MQLFLDAYMHISNRASIVDSKIHREPGRRLNHPHIYPILPRDSRGGESATETVSLLTINRDTSCICICPDGRGSRCTAS